MRKFSANYIFTSNSKPLKNGIIVLDDDHKIIDIIDTNGDLKEIENLEFYNGVITPGFINTHSHIELSFLKNKISPQSGMTSFVQQVEQKRVLAPTEIEESILHADFEMKKNGIVAVGDISNNNSSIAIKRKSKLHYHTFIEVFGIKNIPANDKIDYAKKLLKEFESASLLASIVPHAPYSISENLMLRISTNSKNRQITSIHNSESIDEEKLFVHKSGHLFDYIKSIDENHLNYLSNFSNSSDFVYQNLNANHKNILVHNTHVCDTDIIKLSDKFIDLYWCICPNSNIFIENNLPKLDVFYKSNQQICLGTDSLASNTSLSILDEMKTIAKFFPEIPFVEILNWATINGAKALDISEIYGSLEIGKSPGINLIENFDFEKMTLTTNSRVKVLL
ncbi:MAG TPA: amidohydrolase [Bacteroidales bacterium]|nr:MAG: hypothetical protein A2W98_08910 [Bacteroidetes bacterium GWF2_33_38]OFY75398.1 MAG: hypothetical protein A2265_05595 [Bacteroidetes bacterium RIFOXYA12_FULL_33_9]OFY84971.1 MAG: hypothetical protein A2236_03115 [Bacteroidetes bacterium RIFOXYA2_FULL_33_7]HBF87444.1 amidohydrolase [Bacteroidales bacterium]